jgi:hypothetical protein
MASCFSLDFENNLFVVTQYSRILELQSFQLVQLKENSMKNNSSSKRLKFILSSLKYSIFLGKD